MKNHPVQTQGMKNEMMKFFPKSGNFSLSNYFQSQIFFFFGERYFQIHLQILENPKNFMISFFIPLGFS